MTKKCNTKNNLNVKKRVVILSGLLVLLLSIGSSIAIADTNLSDNNKVSQLAFAPKNPDFVKYQQEKISSQPSINGHKTGLFPTIVDLSHLRTVSGSTVSYPARYDLRTLNKVTPVKDQGKAGTCWTFATYGSLESYLMPGKSWDFSENNLKNVLSSDAPEGFDYSDGGNILMSTAYLARWSGPVKESNDPYSDSSVYSSDELRLPVYQHVQNVLVLPGRQGSKDNNEIKSAIEKYGAVDTGIYTGGDDFDDCYSNDTNSFYYDGSSYSDHAVTIVGWDDSYDKNNFTHVPPGNGAFIVKNSWGTGFGENGYFYVSYYDSNIGNTNAVFTAENTDNYKNIYQYDPLGWVTDCGKEDTSTTLWGANIFTAKSDEVLKAVSFYTTDSNCKYILYIYTDVSSSPVTQAGPVISKSGKIPYAGYHTIPLDSKVNLKAGQKFSVVLKLTTSGYGYPIALEMPSSGYSSKATANAGESFISSDGQTWGDITTYATDANVCIKAFTTTGSTSPVADFSANPTSGNAPLKVTFADKSTGSPTSWKWDFGDGSKSYVQNPTHKYSKAGVYTVSLTAKNTKGSNTVTKKGYIKVVTKPVAAFSASPTSGKTPLKVTFTDKSTGTPTSWFWNFGDGSKSYLQNPTHKYSKAGTYTVSLIVKNAAGRNSVTKTKYIKVITKPVAAFSASPTSGKTPLKVTFTDKSTGTPAAWKWDFGDGSKSYHQNPVHKYSKAGTYTVSLTVKNAAGRNSVTKTKYIKVVTKPVAAFSASPTSGKSPLNVKFTDKSTGTLAAWKWDFGDGSKSFAKNPVHKYSKAGTYTVSLTVKNTAGINTKTISGYITVKK
ncbi:Chitin binding protein [Methanosarcina barkeri MS]|uniref:Chitin binding protein n=3 Tax=Methanosarcina TaxID=2207 RepID=A0A0E3QWP5_METBA|nr:PKD domain-containing protein [Methanosarcina barkeri]AKB55149.1 Chitin binding protein [Methanosarcina barkeri MS]